MSTRKQVLITDWKQCLEQGVNTEELQLQALAYFLSDIGYFIGVRGNSEQIHVFKHKVDDGNPEFMPFDLAVALYNGTVMKSNGTIYEVLDFTFNRSIFKKAVDNRVLHTVYLQRDKGKLKAQKHWVKFNTPESIGMEYQ